MLIVMQRYELFVQLSFQMLLSPFCLPAPCCSGWAAVTVCLCLGKRLAKKGKLKQCCTLYSYQLLKNLFCMQDSSVEIYGKPWAKYRR